MELEELVELLALADVFDGLAGDGAHREGGAAAGVGVELGEDDAGDADGFVEVAGDGDRALAGGGVGDEERFARGDEGVEALEFLDQAVVDLLAAGGVEDEDVAGLGFGPLDGFGGDLDDVGFAGLRGEDGNADLAADGGELVDGGGAVEVAGDEERLAALAFEAAGELRGGGGFAGAVEAAEEDAGGRVEVERDLIATEELGELVLEDFDDLLPGFDRFEDLGAHRLVLHVGDEGLGDGELDVGLEEGEADLAEGVGDVFFGDFPDAAEVAEGFVERVGEGGKHDGSGG